MRLSFDSETYKMQYIWSSCATYVAITCVISIKWNFGRNDGNACIQVSQIHASWNDGSIEVCYVYFSWKLLNFSYLIMTVWSNLTQNFLAHLKHIAMDRLGQCLKNTLLKVVWRHLLGVVGVWEV